MKEVCNPSTTKSVEKEITQKLPFPQKDNFWSKALLSNEIRTFLEPPFSKRKLSLAMESTESGKKFQSST